MELKLKPAFFWPINRTIVRTVKFSTTLFWQRAVYRVLWRFSPRSAVDRAIRQMLTPPRQPFSDDELAVLEEASLLPVPMITGRLIAWRWGRAADPAVVPGDDRAVVIVSRVLPASVYVVPESFAVARAGYPLISHPHDIDRTSLHRRFGSRAPLRARGG